MRYRSTAGDLSRHARNARQWITSLRTGIFQTSRMDQTSYFIDITGEVCPFTFVKTKLLLERMPVGAVSNSRVTGPAA